MRAIELVSGIGLNRAVRPSLPGGRLRLLHNLVATLRLWQQRRRNRHEVCDLDARTLKDIGLTPGDAEFLINKPFWRM